MKALFTCYSLIKYTRICFYQSKTTDETRRKMEKIEDVDVIIFSCATLTLTFAVDMLSNEKAKKSRNRKTLVKDWLHERDAKVTFK